MPNLVALGEPARVSFKLAAISNENVYLVQNLGAPTTIWRRQANAGAFTAMFNVPAQAIAIGCSWSNNNLFIGWSGGGNFYISAGGTGVPTQLVEPGRWWWDCDGDRVTAMIWAVCQPGAGPGIYYKRTGDPGFIFHSQPGGSTFASITVDKLTGDVYAATTAGRIYRNSGGTVGGVFVLWKTYAFAFEQLCSHYNGDIWACRFGGDIYKKGASDADFVAQGEVGRNYQGLTITPNGNLYAAVTGGDVYVWMGASGGTKSRRHRGGELWGIIPEVANYLG